MAAIETKMEGSDRVVTTEFDLLDCATLGELRGKLVEKGVKEEEVDEVIKTHALANMKVAYRSGVKSRMKKTGDDYKDDATINAEMSAWTPGLAPTREPASVEKKLNAAAKAFESMTPEEQAKYIADLQAKLKAV